MKRHISIFAFLLGAFAASGLVQDASAAAQTITGGYYYFDGISQGKDAKYMSAPNGQPAITILYGQQTTFTAYPDPGMKVANWKVCYASKDVMLIKDWPAEPTTTNYTLTADSSKGPFAYLAVNFDYIPLIVKTNGHVFVEEKIGISKEMTLPVLSKEGYTGKWKNEKGDTFEFGEKVSGKDFWYEADGDQERDFYANLTADWTPKEVHPVPDPDEDFVTISSAAVSDGKFALSFPSDARFDYNLLTNANLLINRWGIMETLVGDGKVLTFEPKITEGQPQLFYKVETIQKR